jgi:ATP-dependent exoDNAse (exonuclease V) beta subunit
MQIPDKLFTAFNDVKYYDEPHKYYVANQQYISVTTLIHNYVEEFDEDYWADIKAKQFNLKPYEIKRAWKFINIKGTTKGSIIHDYAENLFLNKIFKYPKDDVINKFGFDPIYEEYKLTKSHVDKFYKDAFNKLIPVKTELVVFDPESLIAGMVDMLFYNVSAGEYQIWDWKTNKEFKYVCPERHLLGSLFMLQQSDLEVYSVQLGLYKYIIEKYMGIKLGKSYLVWFSHRNGKYKVIETKNRDFQIRELVEERINSIKVA